MSLYMHRDLKDKCCLHYVWETPSSPPSSLPPPPCLFLGGVCWSSACWRLSSARRMKTRACWGKFEGVSGCRWMRMRRSWMRVSGKSRNCCPRAGMLSVARGVALLEFTGLRATRRVFFSFLPSPVRALSMQETLRSPTPFIYLFYCLSKSARKQWGAHRGVVRRLPPDRVCVKICAVFRRVWFEWIVLGAFRSRS